MIRFAPNIPGVQDFPIRRILEEATGRPVFLENDANAAALAEHHLGAAQGEESSSTSPSPRGSGAGWSWGEGCSGGSEGRAGSSAT